MNKRLFLAIDLPEEWKRELVRWQENYKNLKGARWTPRENLHITVAFLGDVEEKMIFDLCIYLNKYLNIYLKFEMKFKKIVLAPPGRKPSMIWGDFFVSREYNELAGKVWKAAKDFVELKILENKKPPMAHITLARFRYPIYINNLKQPDLKEKSFEVDKILLMESQLTPERSYYRVVEEFGLQ